MANKLKSLDYNFGGKDLKLRLDASSIIKIENTLNKGIFEIISDNGNPRMPQITELLTFLQGCHTEHGLKRSDMIDLYQKHLESGKGYPDIVEIVNKVIEDSGFFGKTEEDKSGTKEDSLEDQDEALSAKIDE